MPLLPGYPKFDQFHQQQHSSHSTLLKRLAEPYLTRLSDSFTVASFSLSSWLSHIRSSLASSAAVPAQPDPSNTALSDKVYSLLTTHSTASYTTLGATLLALIFLVVKYLMTSYREAFFEGRGGRHSPYTSYLQSQTSNISDYIEYGAGSFSAPPEPRHEQDYPRHSVSRLHQPSQHEPDDSPDVLTLRYKGERYELLFVPYAIAEGKLYIQDIRHFAAEKLRTEPRRLRLLYKRRALVEDSWQARDYGLKQNSEITCVIVDASAGGSVDSQSSDDDSGSAISTNRNYAQTSTHPRRRPRGLSTARHRSEVDIPSMASRSDHLHPHSAGVGVPRTSRPAERSSADSLNLPNGDRYDRAPSRSRQPSPAPPYHRPSTTQTTHTYTAPPAPQPTVAPPSQRYSPPPPASSNIDPSSPLGKLTALLNTFHTTWLPICNRFIDSPPSDPSTRDKEYKKLSESVLAQVVLKADDIETNGDPECRMLRKRVVNEANDVMKALDVIGKSR